jgi:calcineurin-like phosphoesterase family protein
MTERVFFTADNHFGHKSILKFAADTRKHHTDVNEMNEEMIHIWNETVSDNDRVYCLGDFSFLKTTETANILRRLKGRLHLIKGNHDHWINEDCSRWFESISDYKKITIDKKKVIMFHYPIYEWENMHHGSYHLFGHVHGNTTVPGRAMDVGIDARPQKDMGLWSWEEIDEILSKRELRTHHGKVMV